MLGHGDNEVHERPYDICVEADESLDSMRTRLAECGPRFSRQVRDAGATGSLSDDFVDATAGSPEFFTYGGMIAHVLSYGSYRRTLVYGGLVAAGITDLEDDPLAREPVRPVDRPTAP